MDVYKILNNIINKYKQNNVNKSFYKNNINLDTINKATRDYSHLVLVNKPDRNGVMRRVWIDPEKDIDKENVKMFDDQEEIDKQKKGYGYYEKLTDDTSEFLIKPLLNKFKSVEPVAQGLTNLIADKYKDYFWDRDTKDLDIEVDYQLADYYQKKMNMTKKKEADKQGDLFSGEFVDTKSQEELENELYNEFQKKTEKNVKKLNGHKADMARLKTGMTVKYKGYETKILRFNERKFPVILKKNGKEEPVFIETIIDPESVMDRINKQTEKAAKRKAKKEEKGNAAE